MANINDTYFEGAYKDIWKTLIPVQFTEKEVDFILQYFKLKQDDKVLDLMCGYGRHAIALAEKGLNVTAVDNLNDYIDEIKAKIRTRNLSLRAEKQDVATYVPTDIFDLVICMGNSLNFFDAEETQQIFRTISSHLKTQGHLLINSWSIAEIAYRQFSEKAWSYSGDSKFLTDSQYFFSPNRIETEHFIISSKGETEYKKSIDYIFSLNEINEMLKKARLEIKEVYSIPGKKRFKLGEPRAYIVAQKF